ncbi:MAG: hypothetical protein PVG19_05310, partial [Desulfobacterales bacterium]
MLEAHRETSPGPELIRSPGNLCRASTRQRIPCRSIGMTVEYNTLIILNQYTLLDRGAISNSKKIVRCTIFFLDNTHVAVKLGSKSFWGNVALPQLT